MSEEIGLFWKRDMMIIITMICVLMFCVMDQIIRCPMIAIDKQLTEMKSFTPERVKNLEERVLDLENKLNKLKTK
jgi:hypothetical protein